MKHTDKNNRDEVFGESRDIGDYVTAATKQ